MTEKGRERDREREREREEGRKGGRKGCELAASMLLSKHAQKDLHTCRAFCSQEGPYITHVHVCLEAACSKRLQVYSATLAGCRSHGRSALFRTPGDSAISCLLPPIGGLWGACRRAVWQAARKSFGMGTSGCRHSSRIVKLQSSKTSNSGGRRVTHSCSYTRHRS